MSTKLFIGGCERSGTTMLAGLLNASKECVTAPEAQFKFGLLKEGTFSKSDKEVLKNNFRFRLWNNDEFLEKLDTSGELRRSEVFDQLLKFRFKKSYQYFVDHTPNNFEHYQALKRVYPNAKFLHIIRDGRAVFNSLKSVPWGPKDPITAARWWMKKVGWGLAPLAQGENVYTVLYEDILTKPEITISSICDWLGIKFNKGMVEGGDGTFLPSYTHNQHKLVGKDLSANRVNLWKGKLKREDVFLIQRETNILLQNLGYKLEDLDYRMKFYVPFVSRIKGRLKSMHGRRKYRRKQVTTNLGRQG